MRGGGGGVRAGALLYARTGGARSIEREDELATAVSATCVDFTTTRSPDAIGREAKRATIGC